MKFNKYILILTIIVILTRVGISQPWYFNNLFNPNYTWSAGLGIAPYSEGYMGCAITGDPYNFYQISLLSIQYDGTLLNFKNYGQVGTDFYPGENGSFKKDDQNNYYLYGSIDYFNYLIKGLFIYFDANGDTIFSKKYESLYTTRLAGRNCSKTSDNGFILTGDENITDSSGVDIYIIKIDSTGTEQWRNHYGMNIGDVPYSIVQTPDSGYAIGGLTFSGAQITYDPLVIKTDYKGDLEWMLNLGGEYKDDKVMVCNTLDSCIMVLTAYADSMYTPEHAYARVNLVKIDLKGNIQWNKKYGLSSPKNHISNIISLDNGDFIACGSVKYSAFLNPAGWIFYFDSDGDSLWYREYFYYPEDPGYAINYLYDISIAVDNGFVAVGQAFTLAPPNNVQKMWVLKVDSAGCEIPNCWVGIEEVEETGGQGEEGKRGELVVWPNPARDLFNCRWSIVDGRGDNTLVIYDMFGREIRKMSLSDTSNAIQIDVEEFSNGIYLVVLQNRNATIASSKLIITK